MMEPAQETTAEAAPIESAPVESANPDSMASEMSKTYDRVQARESNVRLPNESSYPKNPEATESTAPETQPAEPYDLIDAPQSWRKDMHPVWQQLPTEAREYISQREGEMVRKLSEFGRLNNEASQAAERLGVSELANVLEHHAHSIPRLPDGQPMPPHAVLQRLLQANEMLLRDPETAIKWLAQDRGVDLARLAEAPVDPIEQVQRQARQQIEQARQEERQAIYAQLQQHQQQQRAAYEQQVTDFIESFAKDKPHWNAVEDDVHYHVLALKGTNPDMPPHEVLQRAYDRALAQHPDKNPNAVAERKRKADEARKFASLNVGMRSGGGMMSSVGKSFDQTMRDVADRIMG